MSKKEVDNRLNEIFMLGVALLPVLTFFIVMFLVIVAFTIFGEKTYSMFNLLYILSIALAMVWYILIIYKNLKKF
jgi:hypothetical protein